MADVYKVIADSTGNRLVLFAAVIDKPAFGSKHGGRLDPYEGAFQGLCTMFDKFLQRVQNQQ